MNIEVDITDVVLKTERLVLREWKESDLQDFFEYCAVEGVGEMAGWAPHENIEKSKQIWKRLKIAKLKASVTNSRSA